MSIIRYGIQAWAITRLFIVFFSVLIVSPRVQAQPAPGGWIDQPAELVAPEAADTQIAQREQQLAEQRQQQAGKQNRRQAFASQTMATMAAAEPAMALASAARWAMKLVLSSQHLPTISIAGMKRNIPFGN